MKRSLSFRCRTVCAQSGETIDVLIIFFGRSIVDLNVIDDEMQDALKTREPLPDAIALASFGNQAELLVTEWKQNSARAGGLLRRGKTNSMDYLKELSFWRFFDGKFEKIFRDQLSHSSFHLDLSKLINTGLAELVDKTKSFQEAPPGHIFKHPSKRETKHFFLASELAKEEIDAYFVAMCICSLCWVRLHIARTIHIDTMGIYPIARAIEDITRGSGGIDESWSINNFHSHDGLHGLYKVLGTDEVVLISASTTGGMANRLTEEGIPEGALVTILDLSENNRKGSIAYARERHFSPAVSKGMRHGEAVIELAGEYFAARGKKPRTLTLTLQHNPASMGLVLKNFSDATACSLNRPRSNGTTIVDLISLNEKSVAANNIFRSWVADEVRLKTPLSVTHVIPVAGDGAKEMAIFCAEVVEKFSGRPVAILESKDIKTLKDTVCGGVLVCSPVAGNGHSLRILARDLREVAPKISRHFIVGIGLSSTNDAWIRLSQFLVQSGQKSRPYLLSHWGVLPTGSEPGRGIAWQRADALMQKAEVLDIIVDSPWKGDLVRDSLPVLAEALEKSSFGFLPSSKGKQLELTDGFVYWSADESQRAACDHSAVSYLAMAAALQNAREFSTPLGRLASSLHETVVLDAENFLRFNDGILQASILRAALPHELDYSSSPELSEIMREFLEKIFLNTESNYGEAALEFGLALAVGQLRLEEKDKRILISTISKVQNSPCVLLGLLYVWWSETF